MFSKHTSLIGVLSMFAVLSSGVLAVLFLGGTKGFSQYIFLTLDVPAIAVAFICTCFAGLAVVRPPKLSEFNLPQMSVATLSLVGFGAAIVGTIYVYRQYALSMDEWMPRLQAGIFRDGHLTAELPMEWREYGRAMFQSFATYDSVSGQVASGYRPGLAVIIALFDTIRLGAFVSSFFFAGSIILVARVGRQLWPDEKHVPWIAALLLLTSQQALAGAFTTYAMAGHLFFNLLWLHLFLLGAFRHHFLAALVGIVTASLHQVHLHLFFAIPFLLLLFRPLQLRILALYALLYGCGHLLVIGWDAVLIDQVAGHIDAGTKSTLDNLKEIFKVPKIEDLASIWANLTRLLVWQNLAILPLIIALMTSANRSQKWVIVLWASLGISLLPNLFLMPDQGHGWGYRYLHGLLGHIAFLGALGWGAIAKMHNPRKFRGFVIALMLATIFVMIPFRTLQIAGFVSPYARATEWVHSRDADVVILDTLRVLAGADIARNNPVSLQRPVVMLVHALTDEQISVLCKTYHVVFLPAEAFEEMDIRIFDIADLSSSSTQAYTPKLQALSKCSTNLR